MTEGTFPKVDGDVLYSSEVNTFGNGRSFAQLAYEQVKSDSTEWTNTDYLGADIFTAAAGAKTTVDTGTSTALYDTANDWYSLTRDSDESSGDITYDPDSFTNPSNAFDGNDTTYASKAYTSGGSAELGKTFSSTSIGWVRYKYTVQAGSNEMDYTITLRTYDGSTWSTHTTIASGRTGVGGSNSGDDYIYLSETVQGISIHTTLSGSNAQTTTIYSLEYGQYISSKTVETNTIIDEVVPQTIVVYGKCDLPTDTSITVDVSDDGGSTFTSTGNSLNSAIDTSSFTTGNLALKFNLSTTDTSVTPKLYGYGLNIIQ